MRRRQARLNATWAYEPKLQRSCYCQSSIHVAMHDAVYEAEPIQEPSDTLYDMCVIHIMAIILLKL